MEVHHAHRTRAGTQEHVCTEQPLETGQTVVGYFNSSAQTYVGGNINLFRRLIKSIACNYWPVGNIFKTLFDGQTKHVQIYATGTKYGLPI